ncbi:hypothetical protein [Pseudomonas sp. NPDC007930]|uniref:hypothetical protein n=1 Tax=Pseudomonas sp. NPDC007930 TaxID=3364417 RepID=UPI0036EB406B
MALDYPTIEGLDLTVMALDYDRYSRDPDKPDSGVIKVWVNFAGLANTKVVTLIWRVGQDDPSSGDYIRALPVDPEEIIDKKGLLIPVPAETALAALDRWIWLHYEADGEPSLRRRFRLGCPPPVVMPSQANGLTLDLDLITGPTLRWAMAAYAAMQPGDTVALQVVLGPGTSSEYALPEEPYQVTAANLGQAVQWETDTSVLTGISTLAAYATITHASGLPDTKTKLAAQHYQVIAEQPSQAGWLADAELPDVPGDTLDPGDYPNGLRVRLPLPAGLEDGDTWLLHWRGKDQAASRTLHGRVDASVLHTGEVWVRIETAVLSAGLGGDASLAWQWARPGAAAHSQAKVLHLRNAAPLQAPSVKEASDSAEVPAASAIRGVSVLIPALPGVPSKLTVHYQGHPEGGEYSTDVPASEGVFTIPAQYLVPGIGGLYPVHYSVVLDGQARTSPAYHFKVLPLPLGSLQAIRCNEVPGGSAMSISALRSQHNGKATFQQPPWPFYFAGQPVSIVASGLPASGTSPLAHTIFDAAAPSNPSAVTGELPVSFLETLKRPQQLDVNVIVQLGGDAPALTQRTSFQLVDELPQEPAMNLDALEKALAGKTWTFGWDALLAVSQAQLQDALVHAVTQRLDGFARPFNGELEINRTGAAKIHASGLCFGLPELSFAGSHLGRAAVRVRIPLVAGNLVSVLVGGSQAGLLSIDAVSPAQGLWVQWTTDLRLLQQPFGWQLVLDLGSDARDPLCNLSAIDLEQIHLGEQLLAYLRDEAGTAAVPALPTTVFPLLTLAHGTTEQWDVHSAQVLTYQNTGEQGDGGAALVMLAFSDQGSGGLPDPASGLPYLIPDGQDSYHATLLLRQGLGRWLYGGRLPGVLTGLRAGSLAYQAGQQRTPFDLLFAGSLQPDGSLRLEPAQSTLVAGGTRDFAARAGLANATARWQAGAQVFGSAAGTVNQAGFYTAANTSALAAETGVSSVRVNQSQGTREQTALAWVYTQASPILQPGRVFVQHLGGQAAGLSLRAVAPGQSVQWQTPALGRLSEQSSAGTARYQPPASLNDYVAVDYVSANIAGAPGSASEAAIILLGAPPGFTLPRNYALNVAAGGPPIRFGLNGARRSDGQPMVMAQLHEDDLTARVVNPEGGSVVVEGDAIVYTPPATVKHSADVIHLGVKVFGTLLNGHIVVHTRPAAKTIPTHWETLSQFTVIAVGAAIPSQGAAYGNGYQQIQVQVEIVTSAVIEGGISYYNPISQEELDTLELVDQSNNQAILKLAPGAEGIEVPGVSLAYTPDRNSYVLAGTATQESGRPLADDDGNEQSTRRVTLYVNVVGNKKWDLFARFTSSNSQSFESRVITAAKGIVTVTAQWQPEPNFYLGYKTSLPVVDWKGQVVKDTSSGSLQLDYGMSDASSTYYELEAYTGSQTPLNLRFVKATGSLNMARWESDYLGEGGFSYTSFAEPNGEGGYALALGEPLLELNALLRPDHVEPQPAPARGPLQGPVPLWSALPPSVTPSAGKVLFTLEQMRDMPWQWPGDTDADLVEKLKALREKLSLEGPVFSVRDEYGTLYHGSVGLPGDSGGSTANRDSLIWQKKASATAQAAPAAALHSNAFNFLSYVQGGVDPRTGQYTLALELPGVAANDLAGPLLPLSLSFSPLAPLDTGFGIGWSLNLSHVDSASGGLGTVRVNNGESYRITGTVSGSDELVMAEQKLPSFRLFRLGTGQYRLVHRDGQVEYLGNPGFGSLAVPRRIETPRGHGADLTYAPFNGNPRLQRVVDDSGRVLLQLDHGTSQTVLRLEVSGEAEAARFVFNFLARKLTELVLPTEPAASWRIQYNEGDYLCVSQLDTPTGGRETVTYHSLGHGVPANAKPRLPRVQRHITYPTLAGTTPREVTYAWSDNNFLGYNGLTAWTESEDNLYVLYRTQSSYEYSSTATHAGSGVTRTVKRTYNALHLLTEELTTQNEHARRATTTYHGEFGKPISQLPAQFQLPASQTTTWAIGNQRQASETTATAYDGEGNLLQETAATGVVTTYTYYPGKQASPGCPADPWGFTRYEHTRSVAPASQAEPGAPVRVTTTTYSLQPALAASEGKGEVLPASETLAEQGQAEALRETAYSYYADTGNALTLGRLQKTEVSYGQLTTSLGLTYEKTNGSWGTGTVLKTTETTTGHDGTEKVRLSEQSILNGLMLLERDQQSEEDVDIRRAYDRLQRVISETIAPDTPQEATKRYAYGMVASAGQRASQTVTDVKGVREVTWVDGLGQPLQVDRYEPGSEVPQTVYQASYDGLGQLQSASEFDDCLANGEMLELQETYTYNDWGDRATTVSADGVTHHDSTVRATLEGQPEVTQVQVQRQTGGALASGVQVTWLDAFDNPLRVARYESLAAYENPQSLPYSIHRYGYDGLGRKVLEVEKTGTTEYTTRFTYDGFDRSLTTTLQDGAVVTREYAAHSDQDWPTSISVKVGSKVNLLGTQAFDGLGRMTEAVTGGRKRTFTYLPGQTRPDSVTTPRGAELKYEYQPRLGDQPIRRVVDLGQAVQAETLTEAYDYDPLDARLIACRRGEQTLLQRTYHSNGRLKTETRLHGTEQKAMSYAYSVGERLLSYTDVVGQAQTYRYDSVGRLGGTTLGMLACTLSYDALGRVHSVATHDRAEGSNLTTELAYDAYGREISRVFRYDSGTDQLTQAYDEMDRIVRKTLRAGEGEQAPLLREETFAYDRRGHLQAYTCQGDECPLDPYGHQMTGQNFIVDGLDNHTRVVTSWNGGQNIAQYAYSEQDPAQLVKITNSNSGDGYPAQVELNYDDDGNLLNDESGRAFNYDALGRLVAVSALPGETPSYYHYDPLDVISARAEAANTTPREGRFYRDGQLHTLLDAGQATTIVRAGEHLIAEAGNDARQPEEGSHHE